MESYCCLEYKIDPEPTHTMNTPEPFNDLSWNDDPLHSPNRTVYIERLRAAVVELGSALKHERNTNSAVMTQLKLVINSLAKEDADRMALAFSAIDGIEHEPWIPPAEAAALRARVKELEAICNEVSKEYPLQKYLEERLGTKGEHSHFETIDNTAAKLTALEKEASDLKENLRNAEVEFLESGDRYRDQIRKLTAERDQLKGEAEGGDSYKQGYIDGLLRAAKQDRDWGNVLNPTYKRVADQQAARHEREADDLTNDATERQKE